MLNVCALGYAAMARQLGNLRVEDSRTDRCMRCALPVVVFDSAVKHHPRSADEAGSSSAYRALPRSVSSDLPYDTSIW